MPNPLEHLIMLGNPLLYERCKEVEPSETDDMREVADRMESVLLAFREKYQAGRAIAAPQVGVLKRMIYWRVKEPVVMLNPVLSDLSEEMFSLWDDCMSFPNLLVRLKRHRYCTLRFRDLDWQEHEWQLADDLSELIQHEYDHLDGILATMRAENPQDLRWR